MKHANNARSLKIAILFAVLAQAFLLVPGRTQQGQEDADWMLLGKEIPKPTERVGTFIGPDLFEERQGENKIESNQQRYLKILSTFWHPKTFKHRLTVVAKIKNGGVQYLVTGVPLPHPKDVRELVEAVRKMTFPNEKISTISIYVDQQAANTCREYAKLSSKFD